MPMRNPPKTPVELMMERIKVDHTTGCWNWTGSMSGRGYGNVSVKFDGESVRRNMSAHRVAYILAIGAVPEGHDLHHVCENKRCCNPRHLKAVTRYEHSVHLTPTSGAYINARRTHCKQGHPYTPENTAHFGTRLRQRRCKECNRRWAREGKARAVARQKKQLHVDQAP